MRQLHKRKLPCRIIEFRPKQVSTNSFWCNRLKILLFLPRLMAVSCRRQCDFKYRSHFSLSLSLVMSLNFLIEILNLLMACDWTSTFSHSCGRYCSVFLWIRFIYVVALAVVVMSCRSAIETNNRKKTSIKTHQWTIISYVEAFFCWWALLCALITFFSYLNVCCEASK